MYTYTTRVENRVYAQKNSPKEMIKRPKICLLPKYKSKIKIFGADGRTGPG